MMCIVVYQDCHLRDECHIFGQFVVLRLNTSKFGRALQDAWGAQFAADAGFFYHASSI
jgi:hypothetical protein